MAEVTYVCPAGHEIVQDWMVDPRVECHECEIVATALNTKTGIVQEWTPTEEFEDNTRRMNDAMDEAFDNQYFGEW